MTQSWPQLDELRRSARGSFNRSKARWRHARSALPVAASVRMEFAAALQASRCRGPSSSPRDDIGRVVLLMNGTARFEQVDSLLKGGLIALAREARWSDRCKEEALATLRSLVGSPTVLASAAHAHGPLLQGLGPAEEFPHVVMLFGCALFSGWPWALSIRLFTALRSGWFSSDGRSFWTLEAHLRGLWSHGQVSGSSAAWTYGTVSAAAHDHHIGIYFRDGVIGVIISNKSIRSHSLVPGRQALCNDSDNLGRG